MILRKLSLSVAALVAASFASQADNIRFASRPSLSQDGKQIYFSYDGNIYYVSDEQNKESNIVKYVKGGRPQQLTSFDKSVQYPSIAFGGSAIVFLKEMK
ncbi:MAG: PD40 domain-containing protein [Bacteroidales bacterium]|nr:PD40 domain-containing protein [Bacteroidales bacterium]